jgi:hypothetical protein
MLTLPDIIQNTIFIEESRFYFTPKGIEYSLLCEYLSNHTEQTIEDEIILVEEAMEVFKTTDKEKIFDFIMNKRNGFDKYNEKNYAYLAGAMDFSVSVLYDEMNDKIILKHVYGNFNEIETVNLENLLLLLNQVRKLIYNPPQ